MSITPFKLERYFAQHEFSAPYLLSPSDCDPLKMSDLLALASDERRQQWDELWLGYTESQGHPELLSAISDLYQTVSAQQVITVVPEEGIFIAMNTLLQAGDHIIVMYPGYQSLYEIAKARGVEVSFWQPSGQWHFNPDELKALHQDNTRMLVINTPHNPTGAHFTGDEWQAVIEFARTYDLWLFADEMYRLSEYDVQARLVSACDAYEKAIALSGLSKSFALPGLRIGWLATQNQEALAQFIVFKDYTTICGSAPSELLALIALDAKAQILDRNLAIITDNLAVLDTFFETYGQYFNWMRPQAGTITFIDYTADEPVAQLAQRLIQEKGLMILPASVFDYQGNYFRLGFGRRNMPQALQLLAEYINAQV